MNENNDEKERNRLEELKKIVVIKLESMPSNYKLSLGNEGVFDKNQLIERVNKMDKIGKQVLEMESRFMKALLKGEVTRALASV